METKNRQGKVKVVNALASIHKILDEIAPDGTIYCKMHTSGTNAQFTFSNNGIEATFRIQEFKPTKGGA